MPVVQTGSSMMPVEPLNVREKTATTTGTSDAFCPNLFLPVARGIYTISNLSTSDKEYG
jgi:hypothetical protein